MSGGADVDVYDDEDMGSVRDVEDFVGVRKETKFYSERRLYSIPEYKTLHEEEEERKTRGAYR